MCVGFNILRMCYIILPKSSEFSESHCFERDKYASEHIYTKQLYLRQRPRWSHSYVIKKKNPVRKKKIRGYVQYPNVIRAIKARTLDFYLPIWYPFHTFPPQT